jgi:hypothetical protein
MSQENVELIRCAIQLFNEDPASDAALDLLDPEVVWEENNPFYPGLDRFYRGRDGYLRWLRQAVIDPFEEFEILTDRLETSATRYRLAFGCAGKVAAAESRSRCRSFSW